VSQMSILGNHASPDPSLRRFLLGGRQGLRFDFFRAWRPEMDLDRPNPEATWCQI
jgi:hypothetical protein